MTRCFRQAVKRSLLPSIRLHDLRHTHATLALQTGIHPKVVSERLGHATVSITLDTYSHAIPATQEEAPMRSAGLVSAASSHCPPATKRRGARRTEPLSARRAAGTGAQKSAMTSFFICIMCA